jgi:hypothetical protein
MLHITKGKPWLFWPSNICDTFPENPANKYLSGNYDFTLEITFTLTDNSDNQKSLFCILPHFTGIDIYKDKCVFIVTLKNGVKYQEIPHTVKVDEITKIKIEHRTLNRLELFIDDISMVTIDLTNNQFAVEEEPHIIFGAGNFPKNGFNLNYTQYKLFDFKIYTDRLLCHHTFDEFIMDKSVDKTENCNFIHKI